MRFFVAAAGALSAMNALGVMAAVPPFVAAAGALIARNALGVVPPCVDSCVNEVRGNFTIFACTNADDAGCLCTKDNFFFGARDCAEKDCQATSEDTRSYLAGAFCQGVAAFPKSDAPATTAKPATTSKTPATTAAAAPSTTSVSAPQTTQQTTPKQTPSATPESSSAAPSSTPSTSSVAPSATQSTAASTGSGSSTSSASPSGTSGAAASETSSAAAGAAGGLSQAAVIGIGVGVGAAVIAVAGIILCFFLKNRKKQQPRQSMDISKPLPGSGRTYPSRRRDSPPRQDSFEKYANDIEMTSQRYEDMMPRQQPRTMV